MNERQRVIRYTNDFRTQHGKPPLKKHRGLMMSAQQTARMEARSGFLHHFPKWYAVIEKFVKNLKREEENIADGQPTARVVVNAWADSQEHRDNMLGDVTHIGTGRVKDRSGNIWWVQHFGRIR